MRVSIPEPVKSSTTPSPNFLCSTLSPALNILVVFIFSLSFALRKFGCISGIVITASHNPPEYNGYKVYWDDGAQITAPKDKEIISEVLDVTD